MKEELEGNNRKITAIWRCSNDPWIYPEGQPPTCSRVSMNLQGDPTGWDPNTASQATLPFSVGLLTASSRQTLREQVHKAEERLERGDGMVVTRPNPNAPIEAKDDGMVVTAPNPNLPIRTNDSSTPSSAPLVKKGASGPNIEAIQYLLRYHGFAVSVDGDFGNQTDQAVRDLQKARRLKVDGVVGPDTWAALWVTVREGDTGSGAVRAAQTLLNWHDKDVEVDGDFGDQTEAAARSFQKSKGLTDDGIVGTKTWTALVNSP